MEGLKMGKIDHVTVYEDKTIIVRYEHKTRRINAGDKIPNTVFEKMDSCENPINGVTDYGVKYKVYK